MNMKCIVIIPMGPGHEELAIRAESSVQEAIIYGTGPFHEVEILLIDDSEGKLGRSKARNSGVTKAAKAGADWIFFLDADDLMAAHAFKIIESYTNEYDALWGQIYEADISKNIAYERANQITPITSLEQILINDPYLTLQMGHFVNIKTATEIRFDESMDCGEDVDYYLRVWKNKHCLKIGKPLFFNVRGQHSTGPRSATGKEWREAISRVYTKFCTENSVISNVPFGDKTVYFKLSNPLDLIQNKISRETFFESQELFETLITLPKFAKILDIGSNIGNHALFFAVCGEASEIHCFEPSPNTANNLQTNFEINQIPPERYTIHRMAIGAKSNTGTLCNLDSMNSGATSIKQNTDGPIRIDSLDNIFNSEQLLDLLKIDVEGMELDVLDGGKNLIKRSKPIILIEVSNNNKSKFFSWVANNDYNIHRAFELVHASNYLLLPNAPRKYFYKNKLAHLQTWNPKISLGPNQPPLGCSLNDFLINYTSQKITEISKNTKNQYVFSDIRTGEKNRLRNDTTKELTSSLILFNEILGKIDDDELATLLKIIANSNNDILFFGIMDSRWNKSYSPRENFRDAEQYIIEGGKQGYTLKKYLKIPHKAAFGISYQLDSRATLLHMEKSVQS